MTAPIPGTENDDWRRPHNRIGTWCEPPSRAADSIVRPVFEEDRLTPEKFLSGADGALCYSAVGTRWWCYVAYRLKTGRWLLCRSNTSSAAKTVPKFAIGRDRYDPQAVYQTYDDFDWGALASTRRKRAADPPGTEARS